MNGGGANLLTVLEHGRELILRAVTHVTHGKPTIADLEAWLDEADAAIAKAKGGSERTAHDRAKEELTGAHLTRDEADSLHKWIEMCVVPKGGAA